MSPDSSLMDQSTIVATHEQPLLKSSKTLTSSSSSQATSLKVVIVGNEGVGKTSFVRRFVAEELGIPIEDVTSTTTSSVFSLSSPSPLQCHPRGRRERPPGTISTGRVENSEVGLDIYELELPSADEAAIADKRTGNDDNNGNIHRLSIWDFSGKAESLQAVQKVFFTPETLYVVLWDMAAKDVTPLEYECATAIANPALSGHSSSRSNHSQQSMRCSRHSISTNNNGSQSQSHRSTSSSTFNLGYDSDSDSSDYDYYNDCDVDMYNQEELRILKRKLEKDIDKKVQRWVDRIQENSPGATIIPMATHTDRLRPHSSFDLKDSATPVTSDDFQQREVKKRCWLLKERLLSNESRKVEAFKQTLKQSIASDAGGSDSAAEHLSRPTFLFGNGQKDGQLIPHAVTASSIYNEDKETGEGSIDSMLLEMQQECAHKSEESFSSARTFILDTALQMAVAEKEQEPWHDKKHAPLTESDHVVNEQSMQAALATVMLRDVRQKLWNRSKIVQTSYFKEKFETREHNYDGPIRLRTNNDIDLRNEENSAVQSALKSLHLSGELCYFGGVIPSSGSQPEVEIQRTQILSDFVVLDPTWLVDSIDFILQYGKKFVENATNDRSITDSSDPLNSHRVTNCPTIEKEEIRRLWKIRYSTKQGLGLAEHYHQFQHSDEDDLSDNGVADQVFEFIQNLLIRHDVFVPLSYQKSGSTHFFLPCFLQKKKAPSRNRMHLSQNISLVPSLSILQDLTHSNSFIPENERFTESKVDLDSANLKGACHGYVIVDTTPEPLMERIIVHTIKSLKHILNTTCDPKIEAEELFLWNDSFRLKLRVSRSRKCEDQSIEINSVLLEAPESCPNSRIATYDSMLLTYVQGNDKPESHEIWRHTYLELRRAIQNAIDEIPGIDYREEGICPHCLRKNRISDTGTWSLSKLKSSFENKEAFVRCRHGHRTETKLNGLLHCQLVEHQKKDLTKNELLLRNNLPAKKLDIPLLDPIEGHEDIDSSPSTDYIDTIQPTSRILETPIEQETSEVRKQGKENDPVFGSKVALLLDRCKASVERLFRKKNHLGLDNRSITDCQIPMEKLNGTKFGHNLQSMSLSYNKLETLPQSLVRCLPNLKVLNLSHCLIYELPKRWNLPLLKKLDISHNLLITFPEEVR